MNRGLTIFLILYGAKNWLACMVWSCHGAIFAFVSNVVGVSLANAWIILVQSVCGFMWLSKVS